MWAMHSTRATAAYTLISLMSPDTHNSYDVDIPRASGKRRTLILRAAIDPHLAATEQRRTGSLPCRTLSLRRGTCQSGGKLAIMAAAKGNL